MPFATLLLAAAKAKSTSSSGGSSVFLIIIVVVFLLYFFVLRPRNKRMRQQGQARNEISIGDEVVTSGGILGTVRTIDGDLVTVDCGDTTLTFWKRSVNLRSAIPGAPTMVTEPPVADAPLAGYDEEHYDEEHDSEEHDHEEPAGDGLGYHGGPYPVETTNGGEPAGGDPAAPGDAGTSGAEGGAGAAGPDPGDRSGGPGEGH